MQPSGPTWSGLADGFVVDRAPSRVVDSAVDGRPHDLALGSAVMSLLTRTRKRRIGLEDRRARPVEHRERLDVLRGAGLRQPLPAPLFHHQIRVEPADGADLFRQDSSFVPVAAWG